MRTTFLSPLRAGRWAALALLACGLGRAPQALAQGTVLQSWPLQANAQDNAGMRSPNVTASTSTLHNFVLSNGTTVSTVPAFSPTYGEAFGTSADGALVLTPANALNRQYYAQFQVTAVVGATVRVDSVVFWAAFYNTGSTGHKLAVAYSRSNFTTDSAEVSGGIGPLGPLTPRSTTPGTGLGNFADPILPRNQNTGTNQYYRLPLAGGQTLAGSQTLTIRIYYASGSSNTGRYALLRDVLAKGGTGATCASPSNLAIGNLTSTAAQLTFTPGTGNTSYAVTITPQGGTATTITPAPTASPVALNNLTAGTAYTVTVQSSCGAQAGSVNTLTFTAPLPSGASTVLQQWGLRANAQDSTALRSSAVTPSTATLHNMAVADGSNSTVSRAYSSRYGQATAPTGAGTWATGATPPSPVTVANPDRRFYGQFTITAAAGRNVRVDSLLLTAAVYNSSNGRLGIVYSLTNFTTADSTNIAPGGRVVPGGTLPAANYGAFGSPISLANQTGGPTNMYHFAFNGSTGISLAAGQTLTVRLYTGVGTTSAGRYFLLKDVIFKGAPIGVIPCSGTFSYGAASYCKTSANPTPTITGTAGGTFTSTTGLSLDANTGAINLSASTAGTYTVTYTVSSTCSGTASVTITNPLTATFSYGAASYCAGSGTAPTPTVAAGSTAGTFSAPAGLNITAATGAINLATSTPGNYVVTNTVAASGGCAAVTSTFNVAINPGTSAGFSYGASTFCLSGGNPTPTLSGTAGGTFTSTTGLSLTANTGAINLAASTPGTYTVTYSVAGTCPSSSTASVTLTTAPSAAFSYANTAYCRGTGTAPLPVLAAGSVGGVFSAPAGLVINAGTGTINLATSTAGTYVVTNSVAASGGCAAATATFSITINTGTTATFNYGATTYCLSGANPSPTLSGTAGGTFTSTTGLSIAANTGAINLIASTAGTYTVTYSVAGPCPSSATATITLTTGAAAGFSYPNASYCRTTTGTVAATAVAGGATGTYASTTGLTLNATTGAITPSSSTPGTYVVTKTVAASGGCAATTATFSVTITAPATAGFSYPATSFCTSISSVVAATPATGATAGTFSAPTGLSIDPATGTITPGISTPGTYVVTNSVAASGGCAAASGTFSVTITAPATAGFSYPNASYCAGAGTAPTPTLATGSAAGVYSSTTGLSLSATTGAINLATSTPGTYVVTNTLAASGGCAAVTATFSVTITTAATAGFSYANASYCVGATATPTPTLAAGSSAGTYSAPAGLVVNPTTGAINVATSTAGTYVVTNTVAASSGCAAVTGTFSVTIAPIPAAPTLTSQFNSASNTTTLTSSATSGNQFYLNGTIVPGATNQTYVVNGTVQPGSYTVVTTSAAGCVSSPSAPVIIAGSRTALPGSSLSVYPNPTPDGQLTVQLTGYSQAVELTVLNALGQVVLTRTVVQPSGTAAIQHLDLSHLAAGVYVLRASTAGGVDVRRVTLR